VSTCGLDVGPNAYFLEDPLPEEFKDDVKSAATVALDFDFG
jgi:hypothetical protein